MKERKEKGDRELASIADQIRRLKRRLTKSKERHEETKEQRLHLKVEK